jgi:hypothetical protein
MQDVGKIYRVDIKNLFIYASAFYQKEYHDALQIFHIFGGTTRTTVNTSNQ